MKQQLMVIIMKVQIIELSEKWIAVRYNDSMIYLVDEKGTYIAIDDVVVVPWFYRETIKSLLRKLRKMKIIKKTPKIETITDEQIPYKKQRIAFQLHYHYGSERGRELYRYFRSLLNSNKSR